jgi:pimeloyl-ACP methyl ester carboxylesterase
MSKLGKFWKTVGASAAGVAALAAVNARIRRNANEPDDGAFGGVARSFEWQHGQIFYKVAGEEQGGAPLVLVHGLGAGASSFMWRKNFDELARDFRVYAFDLLGFGFSDKPASAPYSASLYVELIADFIREVAGAPAHIIASSLSAAYSICVADEQAELVNSLFLISPTGTSNLRARPGMSGAAFYGLLQSPVLGTSFYNVMTSERAMNSSSTADARHPDWSRSITRPAISRERNTQSPLSSPAISTRTRARASLTCSSPSRFSGASKTARIRLSRPPSF